MRLNELTGIKQFRNNTFDEVLRKMFPDGEILGGKYGTVIKNPKWNYVIKIWEDDDCYLDFVNFVLKHPNKYYPKFFKKIIKIENPVKRLNTQGDQIYNIVRIEKLKSITDEYWNIIKDIENYMNYLKVSDEELRQRMVNSPYYQRSIEYIKNKRKRDKYRGISSTMDKNEIQSSLFNRPEVRTYLAFKKYSWLRPLVSAYYDMVVAKLKGSPDIHKGNFMMRDDGTPVIIDPLWNAPSFWGIHDEYMKMNYDTGYDGPDITSNDYIPGGKKYNQWKQEQKQKPKQTFNNNDEDDMPF